MRASVLVASLSGVACAQPVDPPPDGGGPEPAAACAVAPLGDWDGVARVRLADDLTAREVRAEVRWTLASTDGCVDVYAPAGTVTDALTGACDDARSAPIAPGDGALLVDRAAAPPAYKMTGATTWAATRACGDEPGTPIEAGGVWADLDGTLDGAVMSGGIDDGAAVAITWRFRAVGAGFGGGDGCSEPPQDRWTGAAEVGGGAAVTVTWTRTGTDGCLDHFAPSGTATAATSGGGCVAIVSDPPSAPVAVGDGLLAIDRATDPATFTIVGATTWSGTRTCTRGDGSVATLDGAIGGPWAWFVTGELDGARWSGRLRRGAARHAWSLARDD